MAAGVTSWTWTITDRHGASVGYPQLTGPSVNIDTAFLDPANGPFVLTTTWPGTGNSITTKLVVGTHL